MASYKSETYGKESNVKNVYSVTDDVAAGDIHLRVDSQHACSDSKRIKKSERENIQESVGHDVCPMKRCVIVSFVVVALVGTIIALVTVLVTNSCSNNREQEIDQSDVLATECPDVLAKECPDGWLTFGSSCYLLGHERANFFKAEAYCRRHNSHLVHVDNLAENQFLKGFFASFFSAETNFWMGMTDETIEGLWKWSDNGDQVEVFDWDNGEPNGNSGENCAGFFGVNKFRWNDIPCTYDAIHPLCEISHENRTSVVK